MAFGRFAGIALARFLRAAVLPYSSKFNFPDEAATGTPRFAFFGLNSRR